MKMPKAIVTYCPKCKKHTEHAVSLYKAGKRRALAAGERHHRRRDLHGYGGQTTPEQKKFSKTTKKQTLKLTCKTCGYSRHKKGLRLRKLEIKV